MSNKYIIRKTYENGEHQYLIKYKNLKPNWFIFVNTIDDAIIVKKRKAIKILKQLNKLNNLKYDIVKL